MDIEQITKLIDAGYTKADIDKMQVGEQSGGETGEESGKNVPAEVKEQGAENVSKVNEIDATIKALTETVSGLTETVKAMQAANLAGAKTSGNEDKTVNDVMKSFIDTL